MATNRQVCRASVAVVIDLDSREAKVEQLPSVIISGPEEEIDAQEGRPLLELMYDGMKVVGTLLEESNRKIIRVEVIELNCEGVTCADTKGLPTLK
ncbi:MAG: hypothetical protein LDL07_06385 [Desulfarculus sp.]|nr:hypothetical protein [Desulfarculus sp.]